MSTKWTTPQMESALKAELGSAEALRDSHIIKTQEARELVSRLIRTLEILVHGEAKTPLPSRHHD